MAEPYIHTSIFEFKILYFSILLFILTTIKKNNIEIEQKEFLKQNKKYKYPKQDSSHELSKVFYEEIYDLLNSDKGERYSKRLEEEIDNSDMNWKKTLDTKKHGFSKKLKLESNKTQKFKAVAKYLMFENPEDKNSYLLTLRTYITLDDSEVDWIRKKKDVNRFDKFVVYESKSGGKHVIGYYRKLPTTVEIPIIIENAHRYIKNT